VDRDNWKLATISLGRIETVEYGTGDVATISYDQNSNPVRIVQLMPDGEEKTIRYSYDKLSRLVSVHQQDTTAITYRYARHAVLIWVWWMGQSPWFPA